MILQIFYIYGGTFPNFYRKGSKTSDFWTSVFKIVCNWNTLRPLLN